MNIEEFREYCLLKKGVTEELPFGPGTLVFKVLGKMFALTDLTSEDFHVNLKATPEDVIEQREQNKFIRAAYHMNKKHWNTVYVDEGCHSVLLKKLTDDSYRLVVQNLPKKLQMELIQA